MIFAGSRAESVCPVCAREYVRVGSASVSFFLLLTAAGGWRLAEPIGSGLAALALSAAVIVVLGIATDAVNRRVHPVPERCPDCDVDMRRGGARFDGFCPTGQDVLILLCFVAFVEAVRSW
jgi:hypothetical protein